MLHRLFDSAFTLIAMTALYLVKSHQEMCIPSPGVSMLQITKAHTTNILVCPNPSLDALDIIIFAGLGEFKPKEGLRNPDVQSTLVCSSFCLL
jgi:hypothetical protein